MTLKVVRKRRTTILDLSTDVISAVINWPARVIARSKKHDRANKALDPRCAIFGEGIVSARPHAYCQRQSLHHQRKRFPYLLSVHRGVVQREHIEDIRRSLGACKRRANVWYNTTWNALALLFIKYTTFAILVLSSAPFFQAKTLLAILFVDEVQRYRKRSKGRTYGDTSANRFRMDGYSTPTLNMWKHTKKKQNTNAVTYHQKSKCPKRYSSP